MFANLAFSNNEPTEVRMMLLNRRSTYDLTCNSISYPTNGKIPELNWLRVTP